MYFFKYKKTQIFKDVYIRKLYRNIYTIQKSIVNIMYLIIIDIYEKNYKTIIINKKVYRL